MATPKEYFNLYFESASKESSDEELYNTFAYTILSMDEINRYIDLVKRKSWGEHIIGHHNLQVVPAHTIKVFDLSKIIQKGEVYNRAELLKKVPLVPETKITLLEQLEKYGADVTKELFGEDLEIFLNQLQLETQIEQRGINAETDELGSSFSQENMEVNINSGTSVEGDLTEKVSPIFPKEFELGISDNSIPPAFQVEKIARVFASHLKNLKDESGQMIGVFGQWGRGKSYFTREVFKVLDNEDPNSFLTIKFQAWRYQQTPSIWAYLFETLINEYLNGKRWKKACRLFNLTIERQGHWRTWVWPVISIAIAIIAFLITLNLFDSSQSRLVVKVLGLVGTLTLAYKKGRSILEKLDKPATTIFNSFSKAPSFKSVLGVQAEIEKELKHLLKVWKNYLDDKRILLFVDDLDRCNEDQIIEIIDSLRVILDDEEIKNHVLILVALDGEKLERAIIQKYKSLFTEREKLESVVSEYMDKLFISAIKLSPISLDDRAEFVRKLADQINGVEKIEDKKKPERTTSQTPPAEVTETDDETRRKGTVAPSQKPFPTPPHDTKSIEHLHNSEISIIDQKIRAAVGDITPRQIRILIYRYLLARNLWLMFFDNLDWKVIDAVNEIMRFSEMNGQDPKAETKVNSKLCEIARMVVAY